MKFYLPTLTQVSPKRVPTLVFAMPDLWIAEMLSEWQFDCNFYPSATIENGIYLGHKIQDLMPDFVFIDSELPDFDFLAFMDNLKEYNNSTKLIIYASQYKPDHIPLFLDFANPHIKGFIHKGCGMQELENCLKEVISGRKYVSSCLGAYLEKIEKRQPKKSIYPLELLTKREKEVWHLLAEGKSAKQISEKLFIGEGTVKTYKQDIKVKLDLPTGQKISHLAMQSKML